MLADAGDSTCVTAFKRFAVAVASVLSEPTYPFTTLIFHEWKYGCRRWSRRDVQRWWILQQSDSAKATSRELIEDELS